MPLQRPSRSYFFSKAPNGSKGAEGTAALGNGSRAGGTWSFAEESPAGPLCRGPLSGSIVVDVVGGRPAPAGDDLRGSDAGKEDKDEGCATPARPMEVVCGFGTALSRVSGSSPSNDANAWLWLAIFSDPNKSSSSSQRFCMRLGTVRGWLGTVPPPTDSASTV